MDSPPLARIPRSRTVGVFLVRIYKIVFIAGGWLVSVEHFGIDVGSPPLARIPRLRKVSFCLEGHKLENYIIAVET